jgi:hypothetical protein
VKRNRFVLVRAIAAAEFAQFTAAGYARNRAPGNLDSRAPWVTYRGRAVNSDTLIARYTYCGDANLADACEGRERRSLSVGQFSGVQFWRIP